MRGLKNIICSTLEDAGFKTNSLPAAGLFDVVEHISNDLCFLKTINFYMRPGGFLFITVPAYNILWSKEDVDAGHFRRYTLYELKKTLNKAGFKIEYATYIFSFLILPIFLFRTIPDFFKFLNRKKSVFGTILQRERLYYQ
jgi:SAM-dependent methyltransferase